MLSKTRQGVVPLLTLLMVWLLPVTGEGASPSLLGTWQGSAPAINVGCFKEKITLTIYMTPLLIYVCYTMFTLK